MRAAALAVLLATPAAPVVAEGLAGDALCRAVWSGLTVQAAVAVPLTGRVSGQEDGACVIEEVRLDLPGDYTPDWQAARLRLAGGALPWLVGEPGQPDRLEIEVEGLHAVITTGMAQLDYLYAAQARAQTIRARVVLAWDADARSLAVEAFEIDFPGDNLVQLTARLDGVDLASRDAALMSLTGVALREADLTVRSHGLFEWYLLMPFGPNFLPNEGDMEAAARALKAEAVAAVGALPGAQVPEASKAALVALIGELPNPAGTLTLALRAEPGLGPSRFPGDGAMDGTQGLGDLDRVLEGVTFAIGWTPEPGR